MNLNIEILKVDRITKTAKNGKNYNQLDVSFKNLDSGKVEGRKIMPFGETANTHKALNDAMPGNVFSVTALKNEASGYWDWTAATPQAPGAQAAQEAAQGVKSSAASPAPKSTYETPEERAKKQVYIVRQSSISAALELLKHNSPKAPIDTNDVVTVAGQFVDFVFNGNIEATNNGPSIEEMEDDIQI